LVWIALLANGAAATHLVRDAELKTPKQLNARAGNENAGSDIYGIDIRIGFYLQGIAFTMNAFTSEARKGMLLAATTVQVAILTSLSVLIARDIISPAETLIILDMIIFPLLPAMLALVSLDSAGQGLGILLFVINAVWAQVLMTWFWAKGYNTLPLLGTSNAAFILTQVSITGWFRTFSLIYSCIGCFGVSFIIPFGAYLLRHSFASFEDADREFESPAYFNVILTVIPSFAVVLLFFTVPFLVVAAEKMIQWNDLSPTTDLSAPGQVIPFAVGVVTFCDAFLAIVRHWTTAGDRVVGGRDTVQQRRRRSQYGV
jgi:hypothetical protein